MATITPTIGGSDAYGNAVNVPYVPPTSTSSPTVVSNYGMNKKVNDITSTYQNNVSTATPSFPTGTRRAVYAPLEDGSTGQFLGYAQTPEQEKQMISSYNQPNQTSFGTTFTAPQGAVQQGDGTYLYQGNYYTKDQLSSPESLAAISNTSQQQKQYDQALQSQLDAINKQFDMYKQQQQAITSSGAAGAQNALLQSGAGGRGSVAQYAAVTADQRVQSIMQDGQMALQKLDTQRDQLLSAAKLAYQDKNFQLLDKLNAQISKNRDDMLAVSRKANEELAAETKKLNEAKLQSDKDAFVAEAYSSGIQDTASIIKSAQEQGITLSAKDVATALQNSGVEDINKVASMAAKNGAPLSVIAKIGQARSVAEANTLAADYMQDPLETAYKKAQIAKIYKDISESGVGGGTTDPAQLVAYAQEYASTGKIPSGLPKGSFGVISQVAKEMPKQKGEIVSTATGVRPTGDTQYIDALANLSSVLSLATELKQLDKERIGGVVSGTLGKVFGSDDQQRYIDQRSQIIDLLSRARSGAALTASEEKRYSDMLPGRFSETFGLGVDSEKKIDNFIKTITADIQNKTAAKGLSVYGISKVKVGDTEYTVGDIVDNGRQKGRVNPDGSITIIQ